MFFQIKYIFKNTPKYIIAYTTTNCVVFFSFFHDYQWTHFISKGWIFYYVFSFYYKIQSLTRKPLLRWGKGIDATEPEAHVVMAVCREFRKLQHKEFGWHVRALSLQRVKCVVLSKIVGHMLGWIYWQRRGSRCRSWKVRKQTVACVNSLSCASFVRENYGIRVINSSVFCECY